MNTKPFVSSPRTPERWAEVPRIASTRASCLH